MKLYTEEQMLAFANWCRIHDSYNRNEVWMVGQLLTKYENTETSCKSIELPSDDEMRNESWEYQVLSGEGDSRFIHFFEGAKWMRDKIMAEWGSNNKIEVFPREEQEAQQQTALEWLISKILIPISKYDEDGLFDAEPKVIGIGYQNAFRNGTELVEFVNTAREMEKEQVDSRVKDLEKRLFNCSKDNADLMAKLQNIPTYDDVRKSIESALTEEQVLTAEEFLDSQHNIIPSTEFDIRKVMIEFAKLHVEEALKQASEKGLVEADDRMSILNAYPLTNIK